MDAAADLVTEHLVLHPITRAEGERILTGRPHMDDAWAEDYPFEGDLEAMQSG